MTRGRNRFRPRAKAVRHPRYAGSIPAGSTMNIDEQYKEKFWELAEQLGRTPTSHDQEYWDLSRWYITQIEDGIKEREREEKRKLAEQEPPLQCQNCLEEFPRPVGKRGRPPKYCEVCR